MGAVGDERHADRRGRDAVHPRVAHDHRVTRVGETLRDDAPPVWVRLERAHVITGDHEVQEGREPKALERWQGDHARVVRPERRLEAGAPRARDGVERARLERGRLHRPSLVVERNRPDGGLELRRPALRPRDQLEDPVPLRPHGQRAPRALDEPSHVGGHRDQVEGRADQGVVQVEHAQTHALTVPQPCYDELPS